MGILKRDMEKFLESQKFTPEKPFNLPFRNTTIFLILLMLPQIEHDWGINT